MTHPNPAGYYSLSMPEAIEQEITQLSIEWLTRLNWRISAFLDDILLEGLSVDGFDTFNENSPALEQWVNQCEEEQIINLLRWITERIAYLHTKANETA